MSPDLAISAIAAKQFGVFTSAQAKEAEFTRNSIRRRCESGIWIVLHRGVYALASAKQCWEQTAFAAVVAYGRTAVASSVTAGRLSEFVEVETATHVTLPAGHHREAREGVIVHQAALRWSDIRTVQGIRATGPNRTLVDSAGTLNSDEVEAALDTALFRGLTSVKALQRYIRERRLEHRPGVGRLRSMLADRVDGTSHSELERIFFRKLKASKLPMPTRQFQVGDKFIDISYPEKHVIIELDGAGSRFTAASLRDDRRRQNEVVLALPGWTLLRFTWDDVVNNWPDVEATLRRMLQD